MLDLDIAWTIGCSGLVFLMQPGFMCLESGLTRSKNSINVAVKNLADIGISVVLFWTFGYALMFGTSIVGLLGIDSFLLNIEADPRLAAFFIFQVMFCGTATTIVSGAVAERLKFSAYLIVTLLISGLIYPLFGHWAWNGVAAGQPWGWLENLGFVDFAGATVVHSVGGWVSLAALLIIGARRHRFTTDGQANKIHGSNLTFSVLGAMLLWLGWLGFNGGSTLALNEEVPRIIVHTIISGATGMLAATAVSWWRYKQLRVEQLINGSIAGMVSITACCNSVTTQEAGIIGAIGGVIVFWAISKLESWRIDDGVDAVALHGVCGMWSTLAVALFGDPVILGTGLSRYAQIAVQLLGIAVAFAWAFGVSYLILVNINRFFPLRVSVDEEELGLNLSEHGAKTEVYDLFQVMDKQAKTKDFSLRVPEQPFTEIGKIARRYNQVMDSLEAYANQLEDFNGALEQTVAERTAQLAQANEELQKLNLLKDQFLANTSHELRTPLNGMIGIAESMLDGATGVLSRLQRANLKMIAQSGRRLAKLVNDILDFSALRHKTLELNLKSIALHPLVEAVFALNQLLAQKKNLQLVNNVSEYLPLVQADVDRLQQILHNLIGNGVKFTSQGTVEVSAEVRGENLAISVQDTGIGIAQENLERIFLLFEQEDGSTVREYGGTGLGLAVTKQLVELHSGAIEVESNVGQGSCFTFTLPLGVAEETMSTIPVAAIAVEPRWEGLYPLMEPDNALSKIASIQEPQSPDREPFKILLVDDEPVNLQVLVNHLSRENYAIAKAENGTKALEIINNGFLPNLILLDVMMPKMTGYEVCQHLRQHFSPSELPILMLTAKNQIKDLVAGFESGANDYLSKPIYKDELLARLKTHLRLANLNTASGRFVPREFLSLLEKESIVDVRLGEQVRKEMSVLFADIRDFTSLSEKMSPEDNFKFINAFLGRMEPAITENKGFIDKFIGDGIMALFEGDADNALQAGISMLQRLREYNKTRQRAERPPVRIGIGINTGALMLGTVGGKSRMDSTVISDAVNLSSRIEKLTKNYGISFLISQHTFTRLTKPDCYNMRLIDRVKIRGKSEVISVFEVFDADPLQLRQGKIVTKTLFEQALMLYYLRSFKEAWRLFTDCLKINPGDKVVQTYLQRCQKYLVTNTV